MDSELKLISLISQLWKDAEIESYDLDAQPKQAQLIVQVISLVRSMDLDAQPKPESKLMSLVSQAIHLFHSMDFDSMPKSLADLVSLLSKKISDPMQQLVPPDRQIWLLVIRTLCLNLDLELVSLVGQIVSVVAISVDSRRLILLCPQQQVSLVGSKFRLVGGRTLCSLRHRRTCFFLQWRDSIFPAGGGEEVYYFYCRGCNGEYHKEYQKAPLEIKHPLHPKHSLLLVSWEYIAYNDKKCYCCDQDIEEVFYYCAACDYAINVACVESTKLPPPISRNHPKWHEHTLALFPSMASIPCNVCALTHTACPFYVCPPCDFVVHQKCLSLPRVIRISRHPHHRISFTPSFNNQKDLSCGVCRRKIDCDYGGYSCIKDGCSYAAHSRCATQTNVWDGIDLEGIPEEIEEEVEPPFERIGDGIIRHFSHKHHHLRLDENTWRDYDENKVCQACVTPIYFGNFYTCEQCEFILHEKCANLSRKIYHPTHPHRLNLSFLRENVSLEDSKKKCSVCRAYLGDGFFYECGEEKCDFKLNIQCAVIFEPLAHESHKHPLYLTSKPGERKRCHFCDGFKEQTFNCIECDDFSLCFKCAAIPTRVRYKHDKHTLFLSHEEDKSTTTYWCEICEGKIWARRFYKCDEYCCVNLHIECLIGEDLYRKLGTSSFRDDEISVLPNNRSMSRHVCFYCEKRCPQKIAFQYSESMFCSIECMILSHYHPKS